MTKTYTKAKEMAELVGTQGWMDDALNSKD